jgi:hypothetical protein|tara:strand:+ start:365 stop:514 length:150 start_codon:yes stop_codon:yes gene_type:complete
MARKKGLDKETMYLKLNDILDCLESGQFSSGKLQLENLINEIKMGVYDE